MRYFIGREGRQLGPFTDHQIRDQLATGTIGYDDLIWQEGMADWKPVRELFSPAAPPPMPAPGTSGIPSFRSAVTREAPPETPQLADRGKRLVAVILDGVVNLVAVGPGVVWGLISFLALAGGGLGDPAVEHRLRSPDMQILVLQLALPLLAVMIPLLVLLVIQTWLLTTRGQTLGKLWMRIRIVRTDGSAPGFVHAIVMRSLVMQLIGLVPVLGAMVNLVDPFLIFREDRRCLHDLLADTTVIDA